MNVKIDNFAPDADLIKLTVESSDDSLIVTIDRDVYGQVRVSTFSKHRKKNEREMILGQEHL